MAASATSLYTFSSLSIRTPRFSLLTLPPYFLSSPLIFPHLSLSLLSTPTKFFPLHATPSDEPDTPEDDTKTPEDDTVYFVSDLFEEGPVYDPPEVPEGFVEPPGLDDGPFEDEDEITRAYEERYGPAYSGVSLLGNDVYELIEKGREREWDDEEEVVKIKDGFEETVVQVRRVTKVVKGGKQLHFRAVVVVGDKEGRVGVGVGNAKEVVSAVQKAAIDARRNVIRVPLTKYSTFPHRADGKFGAAKVMLRPACPGTGVIAGGSVRIVLEMAGVQNALGKQLGSNNALNNARATVVAVQKMRQFSEVAAERGIPMEELWK